MRDSHTGTDGLKTSFVLELKLLDLGLVCDGTQCEAAFFASGLHAYSDS